MKVPDYLDFDLEVAPGAEGRYVARVLSSPRGEASASVTMPVTGQELENVILKLGRTRSGLRSLNSPEAKVARSFGTRLYDAVFADEVGTTFRRSVDEARARGMGLRIKLHLAGAPELSDVPWEYLYASGLRRFLVLGAQTPVVRYMDLPTDVPALTVAPPLRLLLVVSGPLDLAPIDHEKEAHLLEQALGDLVTEGLVSIQRLARPSLAELRRALRRTEFHVLHFIGHGAFDPDRGDGLLAFEDEHRRSHRVYGSDLGPLLGNHPTLRLAVLNACEGARQSPIDPFSGVAQSLVRQGLPAVVAMQFEITDAAALIFGEEFYAAIADGYPVDAALTEARMAVFSSDNDVEWGTPVLFLRARDGRIFDIPARAAPYPRRRTTTRPSLPRPSLPRPSLPRPSLPRSGPSHKDRPRTTAGGCMPPWRPCCWSVYSAARGTSSPARPRRAPSPRWWA